MTRTYTPGDALERAIRALRRIAANDLNAMPRQAQWRAFAARRALTEIEHIRAKEATP